LQAAKKTALADGFTSMLGGLAATSHQGYTRLESEEDPPLSPGGGGQVTTAFSLLFLILIVLSTSMLT